MIYYHIIGWKFDNRPIIGQPILGIPSNGWNPFPNHFVVDNSTSFSMKHIFYAKWWFWSFPTWTGSELKSTFPCMIPLCLARIRNLLIFLFLSIYTLLMLFPAQKKLWAFEVRKMPRYSPLDDSIMCEWHVHFRSRISFRPFDIVSKRLIFISLENTYSW